MRAQVRLVRDLAGAIFVRCWTLGWIGQTGAPTSVLTATPWEEQGRKKHLK